MVVPLVVMEKLMKWLQSPRVISIVLYLQTYLSPQSHAHISKGWPRFLSGGQIGTSNSTLQNLVFFPRETFLFLVFPVLINNCTPFIITSPNCPHWKLGSPLIHPLSPHPISHKDCLLPLFPFISLFPSPVP